MRLACLALAMVIVAAPASAHEIHADPDVRVKLLHRRTELHRCGPNGACPRTRELRVVVMSWSTGCTLEGASIRHHWEAGLRTAVGPWARRDPSAFAGTPAIVDGAYAPVVKPARAAVEPQDGVFREFPEALAAFADGAAARRSKLRLGVLPGSVIAAHLAASCVVADDGHESELVGLDSRVLTVPPLADVVNYPQPRPGRVARIGFDLSRNASSLVRTTGRGFSGAVLHVTGAGTRAHRRLSARDVAAGRTSVRVRPRRRGAMNAWISLSGVRSANTVELSAR